MTSVPVDLTGGIGMISDSGGGGWERSGSRSGCGANEELEASGLESRLEEADGSDAGDSG